MSESTPSRIYRKIIPVNAISDGIDKAMKMIVGLKTLQRRNPLIPLIIAVDVDYDGHPDSVRLMRSFIKELRRAHTQHFIRFLCNPMWAMESDVGDIVYTTDQPLSAYHDVSWTIKMFSATQLELVARLPLVVPMLPEIQTMCQSLIPVIQGTGGHVDDDSLLGLMVGFYRHTPPLHAATSLGIPFHVLLIPNRGRTHFIPFPIFTMSKADAHRRYHYLDRQFAFLNKRHYEFMPEGMDDNDLFTLLLSMVADGQWNGSRKRNPQESYGYTELLYSAFMAKRDLTPTSDHDILLFNIIPGEHDNDKIDIFRLGMASLNTDA